MISSDLLQQIITFRSERDWTQFHTPKDIAISLSIEASELLEWFQWQTNQQIDIKLISDKREQLEDEVADVAIYLSYLCHDLNIDINEVVQKKMTKNATKYPVEKVKGKSAKYTEYS
jgi:NTP pyrophosphatase (non-canonical NTP hydrolase)